MFKGQCDAYRNGLGQYLQGVCHQHPFDGVKTSSIGREKGLQGILEYTLQKSFYWGLNANLMPWATLA